MIQNCVSGLYCTAFTCEDRCQRWKLRSSNNFGKARKNRICLLCVNTRFVYCVYLFVALKHTTPAHSSMHVVYVVSYKYTAVILQITSFTVLLMFPLPPSWIVKSGLVVPSWLSQLKVWFEEAFQLKIVTGNLEIPLSNFKWNCHYWHSSIALLHLRLMQFNPKKNK